MMSSMLISATLLMAAQGAPAMAAEAPLSAAEISTRATALGDCFVDKTTGEDRIAVARWMLAAMGSASKMADVTKIDPVRKVALDKAMAALFTRLIAHDCPAEARPLFKAKSEAGFRAAGEALGRIAMNELLTDPKSSQGLSAYTAYLNEADFANVIR